MTDINNDIDNDDDGMLDDDDTFEGTAAPGSTAGGAADFVTFDMPEDLIGVIRGHVCEVKTPQPTKPKNYVIEFKSEMPDTSGETIAVWLDMNTKEDIVRARNFAKALGVPIQKAAKGKGFSIVGGLEAFKNRPCAFVVETFFHKVKDETVASVAKRLPNPDKSPEWAAYIATLNDGKGLSAQQTAALKSSAGILDPKHVALFG